MTLRAKLYLGLGLLTAVSILLAALGTGSLYSLAGVSRTIIKDNLRSVNYGSGMVTALGQIQLNLAQAGNDLDSTEKLQIESGMAAFRQNLKLEDANLTEAGEPALVSNIHSEYLELKDDLAKLALSRPLSPDLEAYTRQTLAHLTLLCTSLQAMNSEAIVRKNNRSEATAQFTTRVMTIATVVLLILLVPFLWGFPLFIVQPIRELTQKINSITQGDYHQQVSVRSKDELGQLARSFNLMAHELEAYKASNLATVLSAQQRSEALIKTLNEGIIVLDAEKKVLFVNAAAEALTALNEQEIQQKPAAEVALRNDLLRHLMGMIGNPTLEAKPLAVVLEGKEHYYKPGWIPIQLAADAALLGHVLTLQDVTQYHELDAAKTSFIATISHELKTPLSSINLSLRLLADARVGELNEEQQGILGALQGEITRLLKLVSELLSYSQLESGQIQLKPAPVEPGALLQLATDALKTQAKSCAIQLVITTDPALPYVLADAEKTVWVLTNLLANAIRFSASGSVVQLKAVAELDNVVFSVSDSGPGIAPEHTHRIFERFFKAPGQPTNQEQGTGLGLAIAKEFIEAQKGHIWVESLLGQGSTFYFTLPNALTTSQSEK